MSENKPVGILARARHLAPVAGEMDRARALVARTNCPLEHAMFLVRGGTNAAWYSCATVAPPETLEQVTLRQRDRIMAQLPDGLTEDETREWIALAMREVEI